ncbi:hypothetical protein V6R21_17785 [Limibacter armeniacum]|uniref:hypothetical protein n=1 Tax=Limibacter armeniacum TaxID=466084 RepID=UPI002FE56979
MNENEQVLYNDGMTYQVYMTRAFRKHYDGSNLKLHSSAMSNLVLSESGSSNVKHLGKTEKLFAKVKKDVLQAADKFLKFKLTDVERAIIEQERSNLSNAFNSYSLRTSIRRIVEVTDRFKF